MRPLPPAQPQASPQSVQPEACSQSQAEPLPPGPRAAAEEQFFGEPESSPQESQRVLPELLALRAPYPALQPSPPPGMLQQRPSSDAKQPQPPPHWA